MNGIRNSNRFDSDVTSTESIVHSPQCNGLMVLLLANNAAVFHYFLMAQHYLHSKQSVVGPSLVIALALWRPSRPLVSAAAAAVAVIACGFCESSGLDSTITVQSTSRSSEQHAAAAASILDIELYVYRKKEIKCNSWTALWSEIYWIMNISHFLHAIHSRMSFASLLLRLQLLRCCAFI